MKAINKKKIPIVPSLLPVNFELNGKNILVNVKPSSVLLDVLRDELGLKGTKPGCLEGECGACSVLIDGNAINSCLYLTINAQGKKITTIEGITRPNGSLDPVQDALVKNGAVQCGFCTSGMVVSIKALENHHSERRNVQGALRSGTPSRDEIKKWLEGNLWRCTGYIKIIDAAEKVLSREE